MPACTGLPPGLLILSITAFALGAAKASAKAGSRRSALASEPAIIGPNTSTTATCSCDSNKESASSPDIIMPMTLNKKIKVILLKKIPQRLVRRCST